MQEKQQSIVYGINPVLQALKSSQRKCFKIVVEKGKTSVRVQSIIKSAHKDGIKVETLPRVVFSKK